MILIAEDDAITQQFYRFVLRQWGCEFDVVQNGLEAVELMNRQSELYDLCFMDIEMPIMGGLEAIRNLKQCITSIPIIAFSSESGYEKPSLAAGADAFYCKPVSKEQLRSLVEGMKQLKRSPPLLCG